MKYFDQSDQGQEQEDHTGLDFQDLSDDSEELDRLGKYDLAFTFVKMNNGNLLIRISYNANLFLENTIQDMSNFFEEVINMSLNAPDGPMDSLLYPDQELVTITDDF